MWDMYNHDMDKDDELSHISVDPYEALIRHLEVRVSRIDNLIKAAQKEADAEVARHTKAISEIVDRRNHCLRASDKITETIETIKHLKKDNI